MKNKNFIFFILISAIFTGLLSLSFFSLNDKLPISILNEDNQIPAPENYAAASITKGSIFLLLIVGIIGFLGVSRKKKITGEVTENNRADATVDNQSFNSNEKKL